MPGWHDPCSTPCMSTYFPLPREIPDASQHPLARAFASFTEAAGSLERAYAELQGQVVQLRRELEVTNRDLSQSLEENRRMRERLKRILESLPCGVLVIEQAAVKGTIVEEPIVENFDSLAGSVQGESLGMITTLNPEAIRLVGGSFGQAAELSRALQGALLEARHTGAETEFALSEVDLASTSGPTHSENAGSDAGSIEAAPRGWGAIRHAWLDESAVHPVSVFILRDVSDAKRLEQEREQLRRQQALVEMSALLAHEIRNPLGSLELFAGLLAEANLEGESQRWIEHVQAGLRTLSSTVNNVLHLHTTPPAAFGPVDAGELLEWAYGFLHPLAKQAGVEIQVINGLQGVTIAADRHRLEQVLLNLALNAFHFMPGGGWLSLRGRADADSTQGIAIEVRDNGAGIAAIHLDHIFDAGFSTRPGSSGLGLAVCRSVIEQHCGSIQVESRPGQGASFVLRLPRRQVDPRPEATLEKLTGEKTVLQQPLQAKPKEFDVTELAPESLLAAGRRSLAAAPQDHAATFLERSGAGQ
jgi:two-component system sensor histidine kinase FlrB